MRKHGRVDLNHATPQEIADWKAGPAKRSKYRNVKTVVDRITFDSKKEARRWQELKLLEQAGEIRELTRQYRYPLFAPERGNAGPWGRAHIGDYVADFHYREGPRGILRVEDCKGVRTALYRWKKKHVEAQYGIEILET